MEGPTDVPSASSPRASRPRRPSASARPWHGPKEEEEEEPQQADFEPSNRVPEEGPHRWDDTSAPEGNDHSPTTAASCGAQMNRPRRDEDEHGGDEEHEEAPIRTGQPVSHQTATQQAGHRR